MHNIEVGEKDLENRSGVAPSAKADHYTHANFVFNKMLRGLTTSLQDGVVLIPICL